MAPRPDPNSGADPSPRPDPSPGADPNSGAGPDFSPGPDGPTGVDDSGEPVRVIRKRRRVRTQSPPGSDLQPPSEPFRHRPDENDEQLKRDIPPHWG